MKGVRGLSLGVVHPVHPVCILSPFPPFAFSPLPPFPIPWCLGVLVVAFSIRVHPQLALNLVLGLLRFFAADFRFDPAFIRGSLFLVPFSCFRYNLAVNALTTNCTDQARV